MAASHSDNSDILLPPKIGKFDKELFAADDFPSTQFLDTRFEMRNKVDQNKDENKNPVNHQKRKSESLLDSLPPKIGKFDEELYAADDLPSTQFLNDRFELRNKVEQKKVENKKPRTIESMLASGYDKYLENKKNNPKQNQMVTLQRDDKVNMKPQSFEIMLASGFEKYLENKKDHPKRIQIVTNFGASSSGIIRIKKNKFEQYVSDSD